MKQHSILLGILACLVFGAFAMEEGEWNEEKAKPFYSAILDYNRGALSYNQLMEQLKGFRNFTKQEGYLHQIEANQLFAITNEAYSKGEISYNQYRTNMMRVVPVLNFAHEALLRNAVAHLDYYFAQFLLDWGANPTFINFSFLANSNDPEARSLYDLLVNYKHLNPKPRKAGK